MNVSEATATIVKAALDNKMLSFREPDSFSENSLAENNSFNIKQLCSLVRYVKDELEKRDENYAPVSF